MSVCMFVMWCDSACGEVQESARSSLDTVRLRVLEDVYMSSQNVQLYEGLKPCVPSGLRITKREYMKAHFLQGI